MVIILGSIAQNWKKWLREVNFIGRRMKLFSSFGNSKFIPRQSMNFILFFETIKSRGLKNKLLGY